MEIVEKILRFAIAFIDSGIVWVIRQVYNLFYNLSDLMLYSEKIVESLGQRIGLILGIFMLFRLAVSLVNYMISPDKLTDNAKGGGKLIVNIVISLVLLATVNLIFVQAYKVQDVIVRSGFIEKIFFGSKVDQSNQKQLDISYYLYTPLFEPNEAVFGEVCKTLWDQDEKIDMKDNGACDQKLYEILGDDRRTIYRAYNTQDMGYVLRNFNVVTTKQNGEFAFDYKIIAPIAGALCALVLISFCMDLATRAIKLLFLQIIAPIPIISNIDPNKGQEIFKKWYQECFKTYISVFLRIITIDFAVYIITVILTEFKDKNTFAATPLINIALILGALIFAKQVPKLIENIFGIKSDGKFTLNPIKKFEDQAVLGKHITGAAAGLAGGLIGGATGFATGIATGRYGAAIGSALFNPLTGTVSGLRGGKGLNETWKTQVSNNKIMRTGIREGSTFLGRTAARITNATGLPTPSEHYEAEAKRIDDRVKEIDNRIKPTQDSINDRTSITQKVGDIEKRAETLLSTGRAGDLSTYYDTLKNRIDYLKENGGTPDQLARAEQDLRNFTKQAREDMINNLINGGGTTSRSFIDSSGTAYASTTMAGTADLDNAMQSSYEDLRGMVATAQNYTDDTGTAFTVSNARIGNASDMHGLSGQIESSISRDKRETINPAEAEKQRLQQEKARIYDNQHRAQVNQNAIGGK